MYLKVTLDFAAGIRGYYINGVREYYNIKCCNTKQAKIILFRLFVISEYELGVASPCKIRLVLLLLCKCIRNGSPTL